eukprot:CAMPEP_0198329006 /NCGR_PEP_ID=MMETSP1450-20131203/15872_1 /TAXON_ID=753684 ORGANISM="Madagascaria erythrocladiodes, Strain CCMP3234" /NCGR_SAMPLE_ID=MMETSP1450 /ASSEMBLY_ACC=CAM_ASM_001115 /LENGTH=901 /DNA_ID=CAMNT_0044033177 /DNA_START=9 /DNA_END=2714 /DNA_ORIENTATION=+
MSHQQLPFLLASPLVPNSRRRLPSTSRRRLPNASLSWPPPPPDPTPTRDDDSASAARRAATTAQLQPVVVESLALLDFPRLSARVARFAATEAARAALAAPCLPIPPTQVESERLLAETRAVVDLVRSGAALEFGGVADVREAIGYAEKGGTCTAEELLRIAGTLAAGRRLRRVVVEAASDDEDQSDGDVDSLGAVSEKAKTLYPLLIHVGEMVTFAALEKELNAAIDDGAVTVRDSASPTLADVREAKREVERGIREVLADVIARKGDALQDKIVTTRYDRLVLAVKAGMKSRIPGTVHDTSSTGSTLFIEPKAAVNLNSKLRQLRKREEEEVEKVLRQLSRKVGDQAVGIRKMLQIITVLDMASARARHGMHLGAVEPRFVGRDQPVSMIGVRHPLLVWQEVDSAMAKARLVRNEESEPVSRALEHVVPTNYTLPKSVRCAIITGPNTGGKTVCLKAFSIAALMARAGLFVLAEESVEIPFFDVVLADIGDDQSITQSLSTFSGHIERVKRILNSATKDSLVVLDEVGSGTDPAEGSALGISLLKQLKDQVRLTFASTHHGELKTLKYTDPDGSFENASMEFDDEKMKPTFRLIWGIPGRSNALSIAQRLGLPEEIIAGARDSLSGTNTEDVNTIISALERQRAAAEADREEIRNTLKETVQLKADAEKQLRALQHEEKKLKSAKEKVLNEELTKAQGEIATVVRKMQIEGTSQAAARAREELQEIMPKKSPDSKKSNGTVFVPKPGDQVKVARLGENPVQVLAHTPGKPDVLVGFGAMKIKVAVDEITSLEGRKASQPPRTRRTLAVDEKPPKRIAVRHPGNTCDVRGLTIDEALPRVDDILAKSLRWGACWIVHGYGTTGALRKGVREHLRAHPNVERAEDADQRDGGSGASIVYLK